jgi:hypothetical protein
VAGKTAGTEHGQIIHHCAVAVYITYIGSETASNHSVSYFFQGKMPPFQKTNYVTQDNDNKYAAVACFCYDNKIIA